MLDQETQNRIQKERLQKRRDEQKKLVLEDEENRIGMIYTKEEDDFIKEYISTMTHAEIGFALGRTLASIDKRASDLKKNKIIYKKSKVRNWSEEEEEYLIKNYKILRHKEMALELKRSTATIGMRISKLRKEGRL